MVVRGKVVNMPSDTAGERPVPSSVQASPLIGAIPLLAALALTAPAAPPAAPPQAPTDHGIVWAVGDGANGSAPSKRVAAMIARDKPDRFLYLGDVYPVGTAAAYRTAYDPVYGRLAARTNPTPGNHDWGLRDQGYFPYWRSKLGHSVGSWFATSAGGCSCSRDSRRPTGRGPRSSSGSPASSVRPAPAASPSGTAPGTRRGIMATSRHRAAGTPSRATRALVLNGHEHDMQRYAPRDGLVEIVSGAGGNGHYALKKGVRGLAFGNATTYGATRVELEPGKAHIRIVGLGGKTLDETDVPCTPAA